MKQIASAKFSMERAGNVCYVVSRGRYDVTMAELECQERCFASISGQEHVLHTKHGPFEVI